MYILSTEALSDVTGIECLWCSKLHCRIERKSSLQALRSKSVLPCCFRHKLESARCHNQTNEDQHQMVESISLAVISPILLAKCQVQVELARHWKCRRQERAYSAGQVVQVISALRHWKHWKNRGYKMANVLSWIRSYDLDLPALVPRTSLEGPFYST